MIWTTCKRRRWLELRFDSWLADLLSQKARALGCQLIAAGNAADHVHVLVRYPPRISVAQIAHRLKGASSRALHLAVPSTEGLVWQVGYWAESVTPQNLDALIAYVREQRAHHGGHPRPEPWETNQV